MSEQKELSSFMLEIIDGLLSREKSGHPIRIQFNALTMTDITPEIRKKLHDTYKEKGFSGAVIESENNKPVVHLLNESKTPAKLIPHTISIGV